MGKKITLKQSRKIEKKNTKNSLQNRYKIGTIFVRAGRGEGNGIFWSEKGSGFGELGGTSLPRIPRSTTPQGTRLSLSLIFDWQDDKWQLAVKHPNHLKTNVPVISLLGGNMYTVKILSSSTTQISCRLEKMTTTWHGMLKLIVFWLFLQSEISNQSLEIQKTMVWQLLVDKNFLLCQPTWPPCHCLFGSPGIGCKPHINYSNISGLLSIKQ